MSYFTNLRPVAGRRRSRGFSLIELLIVVAIILVIAAIAVPQYIRSKIAANEAASASALRSISSVNVLYESTYQQGFAPSLAALGPPSSGVLASATNADFIDEILATGQRNGYLFLYNATSSGGGNPDAFYVNANPQNPGFTGIRYFYIDQTNVLRFSLSGPANSSSSPAPSAN